MAIVTFGVADLAVARARRRGIRRDEMDRLAALWLVTAVATALSAVPSARLEFGAAGIVVGTVIVPFCLRLGASKPGSVAGDFERT